MNCCFFASDTIALPPPPLDNGPGTGGNKSGDHFLTGIIIHYYSATSVCIQVKTVTFNMVIEWIEKERAVMKSDTIQRNYSRDTLHADHSMEK